MLKQDKIIISLSLLLILLLVLEKSLIDQLNKPKSSHKAASINRLSYPSDLLRVWLNQWNLTKNCAQQIHGERILFQHYCQNQMKESFLFDNSCKMFDLENEIKMDKRRQLWFHYYIEPLALWRARTHREIKLAKKWAFKRGLSCSITV